MVTVLNSVGNKFFVFSKVRLTSASPLALRVLEPLNTRLSKFSDRRWLIFCSPITHRMLSTILLLPQPLGPTMPVMFSSKLTMVLSAKLLKPFISKDFNRTYQVLKRANITQWVKPVVYFTGTPSLLIHVFYTIHLIKLIPLVFFTACLIVS